MRWINFRKGERGARRKRKREREREKEREREMDGYRID